jgi:hypothetical protein
MRMIDSQGDGVVVVVIPEHDGGLSGGGMIWESREKMMLVDWSWYCHLHMFRFQAMKLSRLELAVSQSAAPEIPNYPKSRTSASLSLSLSRLSLSNHHITLPAASPLPPRHRLPSPVYSSPVPLRFARHHPPNPIETYLHPRLVRPPPRSQPRRYGHGWPQDHHRPLFRTSPTPPSHHISHL